MSDAVEEVGVGYENGHHIIHRKDSRGQTTQIALTDTNLLSVLPLIQRVCSQLLNQWTGQILRLAGVSPIVPMAAKGYDVTADAFHKDEVFLTLSDQSDNYFSFALTKNDAAVIARRLALKVQELDRQQTPSPTRQ